MPTFSETIWKQKEPPFGVDIHAIQSHLKVNTLFATLMANRGLQTTETASKFLNLSVEQLHDPFLMEGMHTAVQRILNAIEENQFIMVYGDYDVDGTTSVAVLYLFLKARYDKVIYYIPDRYTEGYGISKQGIDTAKEKGCQLVVALDCGIRSVELVDYAKTLGIDFIICDHHLPGKNLPQAIAVLDPKKENCSYPFKELSGCGITFKLIQALNTQSAMWQPQLYMQFVDLVAVSTCCDIVDMVDENRLLVKLGLDKLNSNPRLGLQILMHGTEDKANKPFEVSDVVFKIGPRINAAGRINTARSAVDLLICDDPKEAKEYATLLHELNSQRGTLDAHITEEAFAQIAHDIHFDEKYTTVVYNPNWHKGVVGIVASRLMEKYYRPTIVLTQSDDLIAGSARSIDKVDVHEALVACADLIEQFGGHSHAAGLKILPQNLEAFKQAFDQVVSTMVTRADLNLILWYETVLPLERLTEKLLESIQRFSPFGPKNMVPVFCAKQVFDTGMGRTMGKDHEHIKLNLMSSNCPHPISAIGFNLGQHYTRINKGGTFDILYTIGLNYFNGQSTLQIEIKDLKFN